MNTNKKRQGFTLIELLAVMAIIGILVTLLLPNTLRAIHNGQNTQCLSNIRTIDTAAIQCFSETRNWTTGCSSQALIAPYLTGGATAWPVCPFNVDYTIEANPDGDGSYIVDPTAHFPSYPNGDHVAG